MEAKDTAFTDVTPLKLLQNQQELLGLLREQAEVSFKAGIREVVEWIKRANNSGDFYYSFDQADWQAKVEEWGIEK